MPLVPRCHPCSAAQRKCDRGRPNCSRCRIRGVDCVYPTKPKFEFVDQNTLSAELSRRAASRHRPRNNTAVFELITTDNLNSTGDLFNAEVTVIDQCPPLHEALRWALEDRVLQRFGARWRGGYTCLGSFEHIGRVRNMSGERGATHSAVVAVAYADHVVSDRHGACVPKSYEAYSITLRRVREQLRSSTTDSLSLASDDLLTSIMVLDSFELLFLKRPSVLGTHTTAIAKFLQLRQSLGRTDARNVQLWRATYPRLQARQIVCNLPSLDRETGYLAMLDNELDLHIAEFVAKACDATDACRTALRMEADGTMQIQDCSLQATGLLDLLYHTEDWLQQSTTISRMRLVEIDPTSHPLWPSSLSRTTSLVADDFAIARNWILFHMCRIKILDLVMEVQSRADGVDTSRMEDPTQQLWGTRDFHSDVDHSCRLLLNTMPYLTGSVDRTGRKGATRDMGMLIAKYHLWTINQTTRTPGFAKEEARQLLELIDVLRSIAGRNA